MDKFARQVIHLALINTHNPPDMKAKNWKKEIANLSEVSMINNGVEQLIDKIEQELASEFPKIVGNRATVRYAYWKIAIFVGLVARMLVHRLKPEFLTMTNEEYFEHIHQVAEIAKRNNKKVYTMVAGSNIMGPGNYRLN